MIQVERGLELYKFVCKLVKEYKKGSVGEFEIGALVSYLERNGINVKQAEYDGHDIDLDIGTISVSFTKNLTPSPIVLMKNISFTVREYAIGGWVEYNTENGNITFPFMSYEE